MSCFRINYNGLVKSIITEALVLDQTEIKEGQPMPQYFFTKNAAWDTGAEFTIVSPRLVDKLSLTPTGKGEIMGIGGDDLCDAYKVQLVLPNGNLIKNIVVYCGDIDDYDILIGMDVISLLDVTITNNPTTVFSFRYPSEGNTELK